MSGDFEKWETSSPSDMRVLAAERLAEERRARIRGRIVHVLLWLVFLAAAAATIRYFMGM